MSDLKACPHCGGAASSGEALSVKGGRYYSQTGCADCGALGPRVEITGPAVLAAVRNATPAADAAWNQRHDPRQA